MISLYTFPLKNQAGHYYFRRHTLLTLYFHLSSSFHNTVRCSSLSSQRILRLYIYFLRVSIHCIYSFRTLYLQFPRTVSRVSIPCIYSFHTLYLEFPYSVSTVSRHYIYSFHTLYLQFPYTVSTVSIHCIYSFHTLYLQFPYTVSTVSIHYIYSFHTLYLQFSYTVSTVFINSNIFLWAGPPNLEIHWAPYTPQSLL